MLAVGEGRSGQEGMQKEEEEGVAEAHAVSAGGQPADARQAVTEAVLIADGTVQPVTTEALLIADGTARAAGGAPPAASSRSSLDALWAQSAASALWGHWAMTGQFDPECRPFRFTCTG